eukprot:356868-Chlamydomonas_euryale.AAC.21
MMQPLEFMQYAMDVLTYFCCCFLCNKNVACAAGQKRPSASLLSYHSGIGLAGQTVRKIQKLLGVLNGHVQNLPCYCGGGHVPRPQGPQLQSPPPAANNLQQPGKPRKLH